MKSGNCTYRFLFTDSVLPNKRDKYLDLLHTHGETEYYQEKDLYSISVSKDKVGELYKILDKFEKDKILNFEEGDCVV